MPKTICMKKVGMIIDRRELIQAIVARLERMPSGGLLACLLRVCHKAEPEGTGELSVEPADK